MIVALLWLAPAAPAQDSVQLKVDGAGVKVVQVDRQVIVKQDVTLVASFPFTVSAPEGNGLYFWSYPPTVTAADLGDRLEITAAPKGELTVSVKVVAPKLDKEGRFLGFETKLGRVTFLVGDVPAPVPPTPPEPADPLFAKLKAAWALEADKAKRSDLANFYRLSANEAKTNLTLKTWGDLHSLMEEFAKAGGVAGRMPALQSSVAAHFVSAGIPGKGGGPTPFDAAARELAAREFGRVAALIEVLK